MSIFRLIATVLFVLLMAEPALAQKKRRAKATKTKVMKKKKGKEAIAPKKNAQSVGREKEDDPLEDTSTSFDFDETLLEGKFKAPSGMVLKGRVQQSKSQMVQLRKNFRTGLRKSGSAVRAIRPRD